MGGVFCCHVAIAIGETVRVRLHCYCWCVCFSSFFLLLCWMRRLEGLKCSPYITGTIDAIIAILAGLIEQRLLGVAYYVYLVQLVAWIPKHLVKS